MRKTTISRAAEMHVSEPVTVSTDRVVRDDVVPQLARRVRSNNSTWVVYLKPSGAGSKVTLGACDSIPIARARELAVAMLEEVEDAKTPSSTSGRIPRLRDFAETFLLDCAERWKASTYETNRRCVERVLIPAFGARPLDRITRDDVVSWMQDSSIASGLKNRALPVLSSLFAHAELRGVIPPETNPCVGLRRKKKAFQATYLTAEDFALLGRVLNRLEITHPDAIAAIRFMAVTGCRKSEAFGLTHAMIDGNRAALPDAKSGPKSVWLGKAARRIVRQRKHATPLVFGTRGRALDDTDMQPVWREVKHALGMPKLRLHDLRHSFASVAISKGHSLTRTRDQPLDMRTSQTATLRTLRTGSGGILARSCGRQTRLKGPNESPLSRARSTQNISCPMTASLRFAPRVISTPVTSKKDFGRGVPR